MVGRNGGRFQQNCRGPRRRGGFYLFLMILQGQSNERLDIGKKRGGGMYCLGKIFAGK